MISIRPSIDATDVVLRTRDLSVLYEGEDGPFAVVNGVDLEIRRGKIVGLVGESGSGKSSLGRGIMGLLPRGGRRTGSVTVDGAEAIGLQGEALRRYRGADVGLVFQEPMTRLDPLMRVSDHFIEAVRAHDRKASRAEARRRGLAGLRAVGIPPTRFDQYPHEFSGGMRQRIMIALVLVSGPSVIIADEATTALDVMVEAQILEVFDGLRKSGVGILMITHDLGVVAEICDEIAVMYSGRIVERGSVSDVFARPRHPYTAALLASTISTSTRELHSIDGSPPDPRNPPIGCAFRARCAFASPECEQTPTAQITPTGSFECWNPLEYGSEIAGEEGGVPR